ncbi:MAG: response regulator transcription factor [Bacteroidia bacterium]|nr:response regulator transcription factor [Bacteroidota bacterium]MBP6638989.1 response regulator transcription factor [Bacteroidia bacterium]
MIKAMIVDDELGARKTLSLLIRDFTTNVEVIGEASSVQEGLQLIPQLKPELVFLDIEMQDGTGFDLLQSLSKIDFNIVFVTAFEQYALKSFRFAALDYLLKPVKIEELRQAIERVSTGRKPQIKSGDEFLKVRKRVESSPSKSQAVLVSEADGFSVVRWEEIVYCEAAKNYTIFSFEDGKKIVASRTIGEYESLLGEHGFMRTHKSFLINLAKVTRYINGRGGQVAMIDKTLLPVARERKQDFLEYFEARFGSK